MRVTYLRLGGPSGGSSEGVEGVWDRSHRIPDFILNLEYLREGALSLHALPWTRPGATNLARAPPTLRRHATATATEATHRLAKR